MYKGQKINPLCLFVICDWTCGLCHNKIDPAIRHPDPMCATVDHIVPLSRGGTHDWSNCQPAHKVCNEAKADQLDTSADLC